MANARKPPGLPPDFDLDIPTHTTGPVQIGDYLDEVEAATPKARHLPEQKRATDANVVEFPAPSNETTRPRSRTRDQDAPLAGEAGTKKATRKKKPKEHKGPARKQINATPEALKMIEELLDHVQTYSVQNDAKASEVFHALVLTLYEAREQLDLSEVPQRGRWGTPTAKSFPIHLKNAFQEAIAAHHKKNRR